MATCYFILGSNLGDRRRNLEEATMAIARSIGKISRQSAIYESEPWGYHDTMSYYNQVIIVETDLPPQHCLEMALNIEKGLGRRRGAIRYEARVIDIDILFYNKEIIQTRDLIIPHPEIQKRRFVLEPLNELMPQFEHPVLHDEISLLLDKCDDRCWVKCLES
jgi:2-amino-4-hydroxy-6-hydroxymethyldihydropteridine diphosphokinase